jgi:hypothetical protein
MPSRNSHFGLCSGAALLLLAGCSGGGSQSSVEIEGVAEGRRSSSYHNTVEI